MGGSMKRIAILLTALLVSPSLATSASAAERGIRRYRGETTEARVLRLRTVRDEGQRRLDAVFFGPSRFEAEELRLTCDDGTTASSRTSGFSEWPWYFEGRTVIVDERGNVPATWRLHMQGTFGRDTASGTFQYTTVLRDNRLCTTGELTWAAERFA
jgi:hypothetical protein